MQVSQLVYFRDAVTKCRHVFGQHAVPSHTAPSSSCQIVRKFWKSSEILTTVSEFFLSVLSRVIVRNFMLAVQHKVFVVIFNNR